MRTMMIAVAASFLLAACGGGGGKTAMTPLPPRTGPAVVDTDGDGVADAQDAFPNDASETMDSDGDGTGDNADAFPNDASETMDTDGDGTGDNADAFPNDASETMDSDGDGTGDNADAFPNDASKTVDTDPQLELAKTGSVASSSSSVVSTEVAIVNGVAVTRNISVQRQSITIAGWGYWGKKDDDTLFRATLNATGTLTNGVPSQSYSSAVTGSRTGSNPVAGSAVWTGGVRGVTADFTRVTGESRIEADLGAATLDVAFTAFDNGQANMTWDGLSMANGAFRDGTRLEGAFYGAEHEGVAGKFNRDGLRGVFGALRE